jgi:hypothetical protein
MDATVTLITGTGFWNPLFWVAAFIIAFIIAALIWMRGEKDYRKGTEQTTPFLSGNLAPEEEEQVHVSGGNLYWGFTEALAGYYSRLIPLHTGILNDYLMWFLGVMAATLVIIGVIG